MATQATTGNGGTIPYGILNLGYDSTSANDQLPVLATNPMPFNAANPIDADVLNRANPRTVLVSEGTADILKNETDTAVETNLESVVSEIKSYYADIPRQNPAGLITVYVATIPPDSAFSTKQEQVRQAVNQVICPSPNTGAYLDGFAEGCVDFASAVSTGGTDTSSTVAPANLTTDGEPDNAYYQAEATAFIHSSTLKIQPDIIPSNPAMH